MSDLLLNTVCEFQRMNSFTAKWSS